MNEQMKEQVDEQGQQIVTSLNVIKEAIDCNQFSDTETIMLNLLVTLVEVQITLRADLNVAYQCIEQMAEELLVETPKEN